ncbi:DUF3429 domain-containing protein [Sphingomicrobium arenosum]|uniref:DUF3429 domain-containing protein n=1 Tax=Sphingomicrobium arenosum TaxID=2233861 RepID=UPI0022407F1A|nr:DUF3429 domain-containing protein [Sphingomicrobium arenosum]
MTRIPMIAKLLGFGGLVPPLLLIWLHLTPNPATHDIAFWGVVYGGLIATFLGGMWWAFASRLARLPEGIMILSVLPSLILFVLLVMMFSFSALSPLKAGVVIGAMLLLSPFVDRWLAKRGATPDWWMALRWPLSIGLALLTITCGWLAA